MDEQQEGRLIKWIQKLNTNITALLAAAPGANPFSTLSYKLIESAEAPGSKTLAGLDTAFTTWKAANPTVDPVFIVPVMGGDGVPGIIVLYK